MDKKYLVPESLMERAKKLILNSHDKIQEGIEVLTALQKCEVKEILQEKEENKSPKN